MVPFKNLFLGGLRCTGRTRLIQSHSLGLASKLSGNSKYNINLLLYPLMFDEVMSRLRKKLRIK